MQINHTVSYLSMRLSISKPQVRFKLASSYSGRVLKHVYEDGQELDSPEEKYPHSFVHRKIPSHLEMEQLCGFQDAQGEQKGEFLSRIRFGHVCLAMFFAVLVMQ